ncbi:MAG TPA: PhoU domain-containing protein, partial [bacterium]|nr:PhoU domain-containing protein [bacterium]
QQMVKDSLDSFVTGNAELAREICTRDDLVDALNNQIFRELLTYMMSDPTTITRAVHLIIIGRCLERIADHATNVAESVVYMVQARNIKHLAEKKIIDQR